MKKHHKLTALVLAAVMSVSMIQGNVVADEGGETAEVTETIAAMEDGTEIVEDSDIENDGESVPEDTNEKETELIESTETEEVPVDTTDDNDVAIEDVDDINEEEELSSLTDEVSELDLDVDDEGVLLEADGTDTETTIVDSGTCGENLTWTLNELGVLIIIGSGEMTNYNDRNNTAPWDSYKLKIKEVILETGVESIGDYAFKEYSNLEIVAFPESLICIGDSAFFGCFKLQDTEFPNSLRTIGKYAFAGCNGLTHVDIPQGVESINPYAFYSCINMINISFPDTIRTIDNHAFCNCNKLKNINIPLNVTTIGIRAFSGCNSLEEISIPDSVNSIGNFAFQGCDMLTDIILPQSINSISYALFAGCTNLETIYIPDNILEINGKAFASCTNLRTIRGANNVEHIGESAFNSCINLENLSLSKHMKSLGFFSFAYCEKINEINLPNELSNISVGAFSGCSSLKSIILPEELKQIPDAVLDNTKKTEYGMFNGCSNLESVHIGSKINYIGSYAFSNCNKLEEILFTGEAPSFSNDCFLRVTATAFYPSNNQTWTDDVMQDYGGDITWLPWDPNQTSNSNDSIIERVREYTSDDLYAQYNAIIEDTTISAEERFHRLSALLSNYGFTNPKEGIQYISNVIDKRYAYLVMTTDDMYCANNYVNWLNTGALSGARRALLVADGLIFSNEISDWLDFTTYAESDYPGVRKYKAMLYDFMDKTSTKIAIQSGIKLASDYASKVTGAAKIEADNLVSQLNACTSTAEEENLLIEAANKGVFVELAEKDASGNVIKDENGSILLQYKLDESSGFGQFAKAMGKTTKGINIVSMAVTDIIDILKFDSVLATYAQYQTFLNEVLHDTSLPFEMRWAAQQILAEMQEGYLSKVQDIAFQILDQTTLNKTVRNTILKNVLGSSVASSFNAWLNVIKLGGWFTNQLVDVGGMVKKEACVEGYYCLAHSYKNRLEVAKEAFKQDPTEKNAWNFYYNYNILYQLRIHGEEAYLSMSKVGGLVGKLLDLGYKEKEQLVNETIKTLKEKCEFTFDAAANIPQSCQFASKSVVSCPVDVEVIAPDGTVIATLPDGEECDFTNEYGRFAVIYDYYSEDYNKIICLNDDLKYTLRAKGNDSGLVNVKMVNVNSGDKVYTINNVPVNAEDIIAVTTDAEEENKFYTKYEAGDETGVTADVIIEKDEYIPPENLDLNVSQVEMNVGGSELLTVLFSPADTTNQGVLWSSANPEIAVVTDGRIEGISEGTAKIYCISKADDTLVQTCDVTVKGNRVEIGTSDRITITVENMIYDETSKEPTLTVKYDDEVMTENVDYTVSYNNNVNVGTATVTITGIGNYTGSISKTFKINCAPPVLSTISNVNGGVKFTWQKSAGAEKYRIFRKTYNATTKKWSSWAKVADTNAVSYTDKTVKSGTKYCYTSRCITSDGKTYTSAYDTKGKTVTYVAAPVISSITNVNNGVKITWPKTAGAAKYRVFRKTGSGSWTKLADTASVAYTDTKAANGTTYSYTIRCLNSAGKFASAYNTTGKKITYVTRPTISSLTSPKTKQMLVKWSKNAKATGYQIQYSTSSTFASGNKTVTVKGAATVSRAISSLTAKKRYYVRIRTYRTVSGKNYYSAWSAVKNVITK